MGYNSNKHFSKFTVELVGGREHNEVTKTNVPAIIPPHNVNVYVNYSLHYCNNIRYSGIGFFLVGSVDLLLPFALDDSCLAGSDILRD